MRTWRSKRSPSSKGGSARLQLEWSAHISWLFRELPYADRVSAASAAGFTQIETAWPEPQEARGLVRAVERSGVAVALLNIDAGDLDSGERGFVGDPARRAEAERAFAAAVELALLLGARKLNLLTGARLGHLSERRQRDTIAAALRDFATVAREHDLTIVLEPLNTIENPRFLLSTPDAVVDMLDESGCDGVGLLFDTHHIACMGLDPTSVVERHSDRIGHVQISDHPGRRQPGSGSLDILGMIEALRAGGYSDAMGLEFEPDGPTLPALAFTRDPAWPLTPLR